MFVKLIEFSIRNVVEYNKTLFDTIIFPQTSRTLQIARAAEFDPLILDICPARVLGVLLRCCW